MKNYFLLAMFTLLTSPYLAVPMGSMQLEYCHIPKHSQEVLCGTHTVYEDRAAAAGRKIDIQFAVIPSIAEAKELDPVVLLAGGPGQGGRNMGRFTRMAFKEIHESRDIILIDQRGMGASNPLECEFPEDVDFSRTEEQQEQLTLEILKQCLVDLDADVTKYTQDLANEDIHEILIALGHNKVNLYGVSWGTRSALLYANQFPDHVRTIIMDGNAPLDIKIPLFATEDAEQSIQALFKDCKNDQACHKAFPELQQDFNDLLDSFGETGKEATITDPNTGKPETIMLTRNMFVGVLRSILYAPQMSRLIPIIIEQAKENKYQALVGLSGAFGDAGMAIGATFTILCSEELSRISDEEIEIELVKGFVGKAFLKGFELGCSVWPEAPLPDIYNNIKESKIPTMILSGDIDPVTPPRWGDKMAEVMTNSKHFVATNTGHNVAPRGCASKLMSKFINQGDFKDIDDSCLHELKRPSFFIDGSGPARSVSND